MLKQCTKCLTDLDISCYSCTKRNESGECVRWNSWCNQCRTAQNRQRNGTIERPSPLVTDNSKECLKCNILKVFSDFSPSERGRLGLSAYCKNCSPRQSKEKAKEATRKYRDTNKERWRALHRLSMLRRRSNLAVNNDESITDDYLKFLYSREVCCWCGCYVSEDKRTLEHIVELSTGGMHSMCNTNMACLSCNSKRLNKGNSIKPINSLMEEYKEYVNDNHS